MMLNLNQLQKLTRTCLSHFWTNLGSLLQRQQALELQALELQALEPQGNLDLCLTITLLSHLEVFL